MKLLLDVFNDYRLTFEKTGGKVKDIGSPSQISLMEGLPTFFKEVVARSTYPNERYKFKGSYGQIPLNMTDTPWVATFDKRVTNSAQRGFDIVLLFSKDMKSCVLSLNQGYKAFTDEFKKESLALKKIEQTAERARANLSPVTGASYGSIDLKADTSNARGYELGAIASFIYQRDSLPSEEKFAENYSELLKAYDQLFNLAGKDLMSLQAMTDSEFQSEVEESLAISDEKDSFVEIDGAESKPALLPTVAGTKYKRDVNKSKQAIRRSGYRCEVDPSHESFISNVSKKKYLEAHHLIPMAAQEKFDNSLDILPNIVSLCPNCHRLIHHGIYSQKSKLIQALFLARRNEIVKKGVYIQEVDLLRIYKGRIEETD